MNMRPLAAVTLTFALAGAAGAQSPSAAFARGTSKQAWQEPGIAAVQATCKSRPMPFSIGGGRASAVVAPAAVPVEPAAPAPSSRIEGVIAAGQTWATVWQWEGNNADGLIADRDGTLLFANNDASNVMRLDPATGLASIVHDRTNTGGAVARSKNGGLFLVARGLHGGIEQLEPRRKTLANRHDGEPLECLGGVLNDLVVDAHGGVYVAITGGKGGGVLRVAPDGRTALYGGDLSRSNGIVLDADEHTLYVTNGGVVIAFDVRADGALTNEREFAKLEGGQGGDGAAIDGEGRLYVSTGRTVDVFTPRGEFLGSIPGPEGLHGVAFGGREKRTLYGIVFYGGWGAPSARNRVIAIPMIAQGYLGRAK